MKQFLIALLRRVLLAFKILSRVVLFVLPVPLLMVYVNYHVDCSGLFQGDVLLRTAAQQLIDGENLLNVSQMDERALLKLVAQNLTEETEPEVLAIGSSRVLSLHAATAGSSSFYNAGMTGADSRDVMTSYYLFAREGHVPDTVIFCVDPWLLYSGADSYDHRSDPELYAEFLQQALGMESDYEAPDPVQTWKALIDPAYFQGNVAYWMRNRGSQVAYTEDGEATPFTPVADSALYDQNVVVKLSDGSVIYDKPFRDTSVEDATILALTQASSFDSVNMEGFTELSDEAITLFGRFVAYMQQQGSRVVLLMTPFHPTTYDTVFYQYETEGQHTGFFQVEEWLREFAAANNLEIYGSYNPHTLELEPADFFDGFHVRDTSIEKFFPGV